MLTLQKSLKGVLAMDEKRDEAHTSLKALSPQDFLQAGLHQVAYIKPVQFQDGEKFAIHSADGKQISVNESYPSAVQTLQTHNLVPVTLH